VLGITFNGKNVSAYATTTLYLAPPPVASGVYGFGAQAFSPLYTGVIGTAYAYVAKYSPDNTNFRLSMENEF